MTAESPLNTLVGLPDWLGLDDELVALMNWFSDRRPRPPVGQPVEHCVIVGDTTVDMAAGKRAGTQTIGLLCGFGQRAELERAGANLILNHTAQLAEVLLK